MDWDSVLLKIFCYVLFLYISEIYEIHLVGEIVYKIA